MDVLLDASAIMAVILNEPNKGKVIKLTEKKRGKSPLEGIKGIKANVSMDDILDAIRESRKR
jgi:PIN domain nuclease of toxin-antitoxin system